MSYAKSEEGTLELALGVGAVICGAWAEEAQSVGVNDPGNAVVIEGFAEVEEEASSRARGDETSGHVEAGVVVDGEQEGLLAGRGPPPVNRTVMLPEFADFGTTEAAIDTVLSRGLDTRCAKWDLT